MYVNGNSNNMLNNHNKGSKGYGGINGWNKNLPIGNL